MQISSWAGYKIFEEKDETNQRAEVTSDSDDYSEDQDFDNEDFEDEEDEDVEPSEVNFANESGMNTAPPSPSSSESLISSQ